MQLHANFKKFYGAKPPDAHTGGYGLRPHPLRRSYWGLRPHPLRASAPHASRASLGDFGPLTLRCHFSDAVASYTHL